MKVWQCSVCKYIHKGDTPPDKCPVCGVDASKFVEIDEAMIPEKKPKITISQDSQKASAAKPADPPPVKNKLELLNALLLKHHAHPISVHTPNGVLPVAVIMFILAWIFAYPLLAKAALINLIFVLCALPFVIYTGILEWKTKYKSALTAVFKIKIAAAVTTCLSCVISLIWYLIDPEVLISSGVWVFLGINLIMLGAAGIAGHIGGKLVFKD